jgi:hypothetical protein
MDTLGLIGLGTLGSRRVVLDPETCLLFEAARPTSMAQAGMLAFLRP